MAVKDGMANEDNKSKELADVSKLVGGKDKIIKALDDDKFFYDIYDKVFGYYAFDNPIMPYGTAKARTGDPYQWIYRRLSKLVPLKEAVIAQYGNVKESSSLDAVLDKLDTEHQKIYRDMPEKDKEVFKALFTAATSNVKKDVVTEARSLLKDAPATADATPTAKDDKPLKADEPKEEPKKEEPTKEPEEKKVDENKKLFTKDHYAPLAKIFKSASNKQDIVKAVAKLFKTENEMFDESKFIEYSGTTTEEPKKEENQ